MMIESSIPRKPRRNLRSTCGEGDVRIAGHCVLPGAPVVGGCAGIPVGAAADRGAPHWNSTSDKFEAEDEAPSRVIV